MKQDEKVLKYQDLTREVQRMWGLNTQVIPLVVVIIIIIIIIIIQGAHITKVIFSGALLIEGKKLHNALKNNK